MNLSVNTALGEFTFKLSQTSVIYLLGLAQQLEDEGDEDNLESSSNTNAKDENIVNFATELYEKCRNLGINALLDDRNERFGVKMNDYELMGFPYALLVGKGLANGEVEFIERKNLEKQSVSVDKILDLIKEKLA